MNWKLIFGLSLFGLAMGFGTVFAISRDTEMVLWPLIFVACGLVIARQTSDLSDLQSKLGDLQSRLADLQSQACILLGYLIVRSTFLPRFLGVLLMLAGAAWLIYLAPGLPSAMLATIQGLGILAEGLLMLWLVVMGVKAERWRVQAAENGAAETS